jgi:hypothetical protein
MRKRLLVLLMPAFLLFAVSACGGGGGEDSLVVGEFVGKAPSAEAFVALVAGKPKDGEREVRAYLCDGQKISEWFTGTASANELSLSSERGAKLEAKSLLRPPPARSHSPMVAIASTLRHHRPRGSTATTP